MEIKLKRWKKAKIKDKKKKWILINNEFENVVLCCENQLINFLNKQSFLERLTVLLFWMDKPLGYNHGRNIYDLTLNMNTLVTKEANTSPTYTVIRYVA